MSNSQVIRVFFFLLIGYLAWRTAPIFYGNAWIGNLIVSIAFWTLLLVCLVYVIVKTRSTAKHYPSAVRARIREGFNRGRGGAK